MSFVTAVPETLALAATNLANIGSTISEANASAVAPTAGVMPAAADEVSAAVASLFSSHGQKYQALSAQVEAFHAQFVQNLTGAGGSYAAAEMANASPLQAAFNAVHSPAQALHSPAQALQFLYPLIGNGSNGGTVNGVGQPGYSGGILFGKGGNGGNSTAIGAPGGAGGAGGLLGHGGTGGAGGPGPGTVATFGGTGGAGGSGGWLYGSGGGGGVGGAGGSGIGGTGGKGGSAHFFGNGGPGGPGGPGATPGLAGPPGADGGIIRNDDGGFIFRPG